MKNKHFPHPNAYPWHDQDQYGENHLLKAENVGPAAPAQIPQATPQAHGVVNEQSGRAGTLNTYHAVAQHYGTVRPGDHSNLQHYDYAPHEDKIDKLIAQHGYKTVIGGGKHGPFNLKAHNYNTGHLNIYDPSPESGSSFGDEPYTRSWRKIHELAHAITYPAINAKYGEGRRLGKLGTRTHREARRAVEWEWQVAHKQRELGEQIGIKIPDEQFHKELNTVMHDAVHRAIHGKFTEPSDEGYHPFGHKVPLEHSLNMVDEAAKKVGNYEQGANFLEKFERLYISLRKGGFDEPADLLGEILAKGKNAKEQKKEVFGSWKTKAGSPERAKQMDALNQYGKKRYGMELDRAPGKKNHQGKIIDKPTFDNPKGSIQHIGNPDSAAHEMAHLEIAPKNMGAKEYQGHMDKKWGEYNVKYGYKQQARQADEYQSTALENKIRRQSGLPAHEKETKEPAGKRDIAVDTGKKIVREVPKKGGKGKKRLTGTDENLSPATKERFDAQTRGEVKYNKEKGWQPNESVHGKINRKAREKSKDKSRKDADTLMRSIDNLVEKLHLSGLTHVAENLVKAVALHKGWSSSKKYGVQPKLKPEEAKARAKKSMDAALKAIEEHSKTVAASAAIKESKNGTTKPDGQDK